MDLRAHTPPAATPAKPENWLQELAYDIALEYHPPQELQGKYGLPPEEYERLVTSPHVARAVSGYRRMIDEETVQARLKTKRLASVLVEELGRMAIDPRLEPAVRLRAIEDVCRYAELDKPRADAATGPTTSPFTINIQVNA